MTLSDSNLWFHVSTTLKVISWYKFMQKFSCVFLVYSYNSVDYSVCKNAIV